MYRLPAICGILAGLFLPPGAGAGDLALARYGREIDGICYRRIAACVVACGPVDDESDDSCIDGCLRVELCGAGDRRSTRGSLPDDRLPASTMPDGRLPGDRLPDSRLP